MEEPRSLGFSSSLSPPTPVSAPQSLIPGSGRSIHDLWIGPGQARVCVCVRVCVRVHARVPGRGCVRGSTRRAPVCVCTCIFATDTCGWSRALNDADTLKRQDKVAHGDP